MSVLFNSHSLRVYKTQAHLQKSEGGLFLHRWVEDQLIKSLDHSLGHSLQKGWVTRGFYHTKSPLNMHSFCEKDLVTDPCRLPFQSSSILGFVDCMELYLYNDVPTALQEIKRILRPQGWYHCAFLGGDSGRLLRKHLLEIEARYYGSASLKFAPLIRPETMVALLQKLNFKNIVTEKIELSVHYSSLKNMHKDIKQAGEHKLFFNRSVHQPHLWRTIENQWQNFMPLKLEIIFATARV